MSILLQRENKVDVCQAYTMGEEIVQKLMGFYEKEMQENKYYSEGKNKEDLVLKLCQDRKSVV